MDFEKCMTISDGMSNGSGGRIRQYSQPRKASDGVLNIQPNQIPIDGKWCPDLPTGEVIVLAGPMGYGKTHACSRKVGVSGKAVVITPNILLTDLAAERLGIRSYNRMTGDLKASEGGFAVCLPSIVRMDMDNFYETLSKESGRWTILIDEVEPIMSMIHEDSLMVQRTSFGTAKTGVEVYNRLMAIIKVAKETGNTAVLADAYPTNRLIGELSDNGIGVIHLSPDYFEVSKRRKTWMYESFETILRVIDDKISGGERLTIGCDTQANVRVISATLRIQHPEKSVIEIHGECLEEDRQKILTGIRKGSIGCDVLVFNQAMNSGVSLEEEGFTSFLIASVHNGTNGPQLRQFTGRTRYPKSNEEHVYIASVVKGFETDFYRLLDIETKKALANFESSEFAFEDGRAFRTLRNPRFVRSKAWNAWYRNTTSNNCRKWFEDAALGDGGVVEYVPDDPEDIREIYKQTYRDNAEAVSQGKVEEIRSAKALVREAALSVSKKSSKAARDGASKFFMLEFFGEDITDDDIRKYKSVKAEVNRALDVRLFDGGLGKSVAREDALSSRDLGGDVMSVLMKGKYPKAAAYWCLFSMIGLRGLLFDLESNVEKILEIRFHKQTFTEEMFNAVMNLNDEFDIHANLGVSPPKNLDGMVGFFCRLLKKIGIDSDKTMGSVGGVAFKAKRINKQSLMELIRRSRRSFMKKTGGRVSPIGEEAERGFYAHIDGIDGLPDSDTGDDSEYGEDELMDY